MIIKWRGGTRYKFIGEYYWYCTCTCIPKPYQVPGYGYTTVISPPVRYKHILQFLFNLWNICHIFEYYPLFMYRCMYSRKHPTTNLYGILLHVVDTDNISNILRINCAWFLLMFINFVCETITHPSLTPIYHPHTNQPHTIALFKAGPGVWDWSMRWSRVSDCSHIKTTDRFTIKIAQTLKPQIHNKDCPHIKTKDSQ